MTLLRSYADGYPLQKWLFEHIFPVEERLTAEDAYWGSMLGIMEMMSSGTTAFADMYFFMEQTARAAEEAGIRALLCQGLTAFGQVDGLGELDGVKNAVRLFEDCDGMGDGRVRVNFGPHAEYTNNADSLRYYAELAQRYGASLHIHISETANEHNECIDRHGKTPVELLESIGFLRSKVIAAHCVYVTDEDMAIMKAHGVSVAHNPGSNLKLGSGIAPVPRMLEKGLNVALGTDGAASNNNLNMLEEINLAALIHKGVGYDPTVITAFEAVKMATVNGAAALGIDKAGVIKEGYKADLVIIDAFRPHMRPMHNPISNIAFSANGGDIDTVICNGRVVFSKGEFKTIDAERVYYNIERCKNRLFG